MPVRQKQARLLGRQLGAIAPRLLIASYFGSEAWIGKNAALVRAFVNAINRGIDAHNANLAQVSSQQNDDMRKISAWVAIAALPTMVAGIYGMNFEHMPELSSPIGYPAVVGLTAGGCVLLYRSFRKRHWL